MNTVHCYVDCADGLWGVECRQHCNCSVQHSEGCDAVTGRCHCLPGRTGSRCTDGKLETTIIDQFYIL